MRYVYTMSVCFLVMGSTWWYKFSINIAFQYMNKIYAGPPEWTNLPFLSMVCFGTKLDYSWRVHLGSKWTTDQISLVQNQKQFALQIIHYTQLLCKSLQHEHYRENSRYWTLTKGPKKMKEPFWSFHRTRTKYDMQSTF